MSPTTLASLLRRPAVTLSCGWLAVVVLGAIFADVIAPVPPLDQDLGATLTGPSAAHLLGTDGLGRDVLSRLLHGARPSLGGAVIAVVVFLGVGAPLGVLAGYVGGRTDRVVALIAEVLFAVPGIIILLVVLAVFGNSVPVAMATLGVLGAGGLIRVLRGSVLEVRQELYVRAARTSGLTEPQIVRRHVLPRLAGPIIVQTSLFAGAALVVETALGFLGFGAPPPDPSWGNLVADASRALSTHPWLLVPTGTTIALSVLSLGLLGDGLRDVLAERWSGAPTDLTDIARPARGRPGSMDVHGHEAVDPDALLSVRGLTISFPVDGQLTPVVTDVSLDVARSEILGLVGESGCGKTVTAMAVLGLLRGGGRVSAGTITFDGRELTAMSSAERAALRGSRIAFISQEPIAGLDPGRTVRQQLRAIVRRHHRCSRREADDRVLRLLEDVRIPDPARWRDAYPHQLSGGMAQRIGIAAALAGEPALLIADEPTTALDVTIQAEILDLLVEIRHRTGMAIVLVTHDFGVLRTCDRALVLYAGQVVEAAPVAALLRRPHMPYTVGLIDSDPARIAPGHTLHAIAGTVPTPLEWPEGCRFQDRCPIATDRCREGHIPLAAVDGAQVARCLYPGDLVPVGDRDPVEGARARTVTTSAVPSAPLLQVIGLSVTYPARRGAGAHHALEDVDLVLEHGRTLGVVGESGAGKSTLGAAVLGLVGATSGRILFEGRDITGLRGRERRALAREIQVVYQDPVGSLNPARTVAQTLEEPLRLTAGLPRDEARRAVGDLLRQVGLPEEAAERYPAHFSGGQRQRIAIARALALRPKLIVCDEAVSALDLSVQAQVLNLLDRLQRDLGVAYLFISHDLGVVKHVADDIAVMRHGRVIEHGPTTRVYADPSSTYTRQLLDAAPSTDHAGPTERSRPRHEVTTDG